MNEKRSFSVAVIGISDSERQILKNIFKLSSYRTRSYALKDTPAEAEILIVNESTKDAINDAMRAQESQIRKAPIVLVATSQTPSYTYIIRRPFGATRVLSVLDKVAIKELSFVPELVISDDNELSSSAADVLKDPVKSEPQQKRFRALVVDDSLAVRKLMELEFRMLNIAADFAENASQAFELIRRVKYDIILLDVVLPDIDGYKVCRNIKKEKATKDTPVLMLTSKSSTFDRVRGKLSGCNSYLTKPAQSDTFQQIIRKYIPVDVNTNNISYQTDLAEHENLIRLAKSS